MVLKLGVHWFRQDLIVNHNPSIEALAKRVDKIIPIFIFDPKLRIGSVSKWWLEQSLKNLSDTIRKKNGLALSSRNSYLDKTLIKIAPLFYKIFV